MPDRPSSGARTLMAAAALAAAFMPSPARAQAPQQQVQPGSAKSQPLTLTSDLAVAVVDVNDIAQLMRGVQTIIASQVRGVEIVVDSTGTRLRISPASSKGNAAPLFVIDGVPLADGYGLTIRTASLERIDLFRDSASTAPYGLRGSNGVVLIATTPRK